MVVLIVIATLAGVLSCVLELLVLTPTRLGARGLAWASGQRS